MSRQATACGTGRTYSSAFTLLVSGVQVEASPSVAVATEALEVQVRCLAFPTFVTLLCFSVESPQGCLLLIDRKLLQSCQFWISRSRLQPRLFQFRNVHSTVKN